MAKTTYPIAACFPNLACNTIHNTEMLVAYGFNLKDVFIHDLNATTFR